jgi:small GTP-binding protein
MELLAPGCKVVLLGNSGVGKTSLVMQWTTGNYEAQVGPTIGANHQRKTITINREDVDLFLWDTAGQEQFQALAPLYAHSAACAVIVAAVDDADSFRGIATWMDLVNRSCDKPPPMVLFVNKMDKTDRIKFSREEIKDRYKATFSGIFFVAARTGEGVEAAFSHAAECAYEFLVETMQVRKKSLELGDSGKSGCC